jgi:hypothetical protein
MMIWALGAGCFIAGLAFGWALFRNERTYQEGWRDGERYGRLEGYRAALKKMTARHLIDPRTGDWPEDN